MNSFTPTQKVSLALILVKQASYFNPAEMGALAQKPEGELTENERLVLRAEAARQAADEGKPSRGKAVLMKALIGALLGGGIGGLGGAAMPSSAPEFLVNPPGYDPETFRRAQQTGNTMTGGMLGAAAGGGIGALAGLLSKPAAFTPTQKLRLALTKVAWAPSDILSDASSAIGNYAPLNQKNQLMNALLMAGGGAGIGALTGMGRDEEGKTHKLRNAILGALAGAGASSMVQPIGRGLMNEHARGVVREKMPRASEVMTNGLGDFLGGAASDRLSINALREEAARRQQM